MPHHVCGDTAALDVQNVGSIFFHIVDETQRRVDGAGFIQQQPDAQIHFQEGKAHFHPLFQRQTHVMAGVFSVHIGVAVDTHLVPELSAQHLVQGNAVGLTGQIPQGNFDTADAAALPGGAAELFDFPEDFIHIAGVFAQNPAFQHQGVGLAGSIPDFAVAADALIGHDLQNGAALGRAVNIHEAHIGDFQIAGAGTVIHTKSSIYVVDFPEPGL